MPAPAASGWSGRRVGIAPTGKAPPCHGARGWRAFVSSVPNATLCTDDQLARVGFMDPKAVENFVKVLEAAGLVFLRSGKCADIAVVDQQRGPTMPSDWLEFARIPFGKTGGKVAACWLF